MTDLKVQQLLDMLIEEGTATLGAEKASKCSMIMMLYDLKERMRESNNKELAIELGVRTHCSEGCRGCAND